MILPDVVLYQLDNQKLRTYILDNFLVQCFVNLGDVFEKVTRPACILIFRESAEKLGIVKVGDLSNLGKSDKPRKLADDSLFQEYPLKKIREIPGTLFITKELRSYAIWTKANQIPNRLLESLVDQDGIQRGVSPDLKEAFLVDSKTASAWGLERQKLRKVLVGGKHVKRYLIERPDLYVIYTNRADNFKELPNIRKYIDQFKGQITCREVLDKKHPIYALHRPREKHIFLKPQKLIGVITGDEIIVALDEEQLFATDGLYLFGLKDKIDIKYIMGLLNSRLFVFLYRLLALETGRVMAQVKPTILNELPIRVIDFTDRVEVKIHSQFVKLVEQMLSLKNQFKNATVLHEKTFVQRQIDTTSRQVDQLAYELYDLTEDEIKIVEDAA